MLTYLLSDDLIFSSRATATARSLGQDITVARSLEQLRTLLAARPPRCLLLDLHHPNLIISQFTKDLAQPRPFIVAYGSHVDTATLQAARDAGCDLVLPRSKFFQELAAALLTWCGADKAQDQAL